MKHATYEVTYIVTYKNPFIPLALFGTYISEYAYSVISVFVHGSPDLHSYK